MKVYLASGFRQREELRRLASMLNEKGIDVCSKWIYIEKRPERQDPNFDQWAGMIASSNLIDLLMAEALVIDANGIAPDNNGGVHFEFGFCCGRDLPIYLIGPRGNTFHWLPEVRRVESYEQMVGILALPKNDPAAIKLT